MSRKLRLEDILDLRAYERERPQARERIMAIKRRRRVSVGPIITLVFENRETMWFQVQEMARAERLLRDEQIEEELRVYNPLIPEPGQLSATLFLELTSSAEMREWLPKLVGIEQAVRMLLLAEGCAAPPVVFAADAMHHQQLTREAVTASVHYVRAHLTPEQTAAFRAGPVVLAIDHPAYQHQVTLNDETRRELLADLDGD